MAPPELWGFVLYLVERYWWAFAIIGVIILVYVVRELFFYVYLSYYLRRKEERNTTRKQARSLPERRQDVSPLDALQRGVSQGYDIPTETSPSPGRAVDKKELIRDRIESIIATEDIHNLLSQLEKKTEEVLPKVEEKKGEAPAKDEREEREEKPEEVRRLIMRKARLILSIKKLDEDLSHGRIAQDVFSKQRTEYISELADTEEALIEYELKIRSRKREESR
jgi:hypothetical protein